MHVAELFFFLLPLEKSFLGRTAYSETGRVVKFTDARAKLKNKRGRKWSY